MSKPLYVFGDTPYASVVASLAGSLRGFELAGFAVDAAQRRNRTRDGLDIVDLEVLSPDGAGACALLLAVGYRCMRSRAALYERVSQAGFEMPVLIAKGAHVASSVKLGPNSIVMPGAVVEHNVRMGPGNVIWSNATICHDSSLGAHNFIAANATVGGHVTVGARCFLGFSSTVEQCRTLGDEVLLGAMSYLHCDAGSWQQWLGVPASLRAEHEAQGLKVEDPGTGA